MLFNCKALWEAMVSILGFSFFIIFIANHIRKEKAAVRGSPEAAVGSSQGLLHRKRRHSGSAWASMGQRESWSCGERRLSPQQEVSVSHGRGAFWLS